MRKNLRGIIDVDFDVTGQLLIIYCAFVRYWEFNEAEHQLFMDLKMLMIQLGGRCCIILSLSWCLCETSKANRNVSE
jgi:hypothetical protein